MSDCTRIRGRKSCKWAGDKRERDRGSGGDHWNVCQLSIKHFFIGSPSCCSSLSILSVEAMKLKLKINNKKSRHRLISSGKSVRRRAGVEAVSPAAAAARRQRISLLKNRDYKSIFSTGVQTVGERSRRTRTGMLMRRRRRRKGFTAFTCRSCVRERELIQFQRDFWRQRRDCFLCVRSVLVWGCSGGGR